MFYGQNAATDFKTPKLTENNLKIIKHLFCEQFIFNAATHFLPRFKGNNAARCDMNHLASLWVATWTLAFILDFKVTKPR